MSINNSKVFTRTGDDRPGFNAVGSARAGRVLPAGQKLHCIAAQVSYVAVMNWQQVIAAVVVGIAAYGLWCHWRRDWSGQASSSSCRGCSGCSSPGSPQNVSKS